ncbi:MAG: helix-turn-helix domain-containing protein [Bacteroidales bacterium]|jgi:transcriptional regulator with XRE-family HTH domain|nr:helix-turn-helix domain-containing protein [Bacteroidales bacterium]
MNYDKLIDLLNDGETIAIKAKITGISRSYFYQIINRRCNMTVSNLEKIASYFNVKMSYFFDEQYNMTPEMKVVILEKELEYVNKLLTERERTIKAYELILKKKKIIPY